jgi:hypothetical protein
MAYEWHPYQSRKFIVAILSISMAFTLALMEKLTGEFATIVTVVNVAYHGANAYIDRKNNG